MEGECPAIQSVAELFAKLIESGFKVFLVTGRDEENLGQVTSENLHREGFVGYERLILRYNQNRSFFPRHTLTRFTYRIPSECFWLGPRRRKGGARWSSRRRYGGDWWSKGTVFGVMLEISGAIFEGHLWEIVLLSYLILCISFLKCQ